MEKTRLPQATGTKVKDKIITLMQFARKAGKLIHGFEACQRGLNHNLIRVLIVAEDISERTMKSLDGINRSLDHPIKMISLGSKAELSAALGLPESGIFGISDRNFATRIIEYWQAKA